MLFFIEVVKIEFLALISPPIYFPSCWQSMNIELLWKVLFGASILLTSGEWSLGR